MRNTSVKLWLRMLSYVGSTNAVKVDRNRKRSPNAMSRENRVAYPFTVFVEPALLTVTSFDLLKVFWLADYEFQDFFREILGKPL